jgi:hypothetical protein
MEPIHFARLKPSARLKISGGVRGQASHLLIEKLGVGPASHVWTADLGFFSHTFLHAAVPFAADGFTLNIPGLRTRSEESAQRNPSHARPPQAIVSPSAIEHQMARRDEDRHGE